MNNPTPIADTTDHLSFACACGYAPMPVKSIKTPAPFYCAREKVDKCTYIYLHCPKCGYVGQRKIYWECPKSAPAWY